MYINYVTVIFCSKGGKLKGVVFSAKQDSANQSFIQPITEK